jgi:phage shock protein C
MKRLYMKRLYKSETNRVFAGVMGGIGEYFNIDPVLIRIAYLIITITTAVVPGIVAYMIMTIIVPRRVDTPPTTTN